MTRVLPLPAPARISTGPSVVSTASRCCGFSWSRKDNAGVAPESLIQFYRECVGRTLLSAPVDSDFKNFGAQAMLHRQDQLQRQRIEPALSLSKGVSAPH